MTIGLETTCMIVLVKFRRQYTTREPTADASVASEGKERRRKKNEEAKKICPDTRSSNLYDSIHFVVN